MKGDVDAKRREDVCMRSARSPAKCREEKMQKEKEGICG